MNVKLHTKGISGSQVTKPGEEPGAQYACVLEIDGRLYDRVHNVEVTGAGDGFWSLRIEVTPSRLEIVNHDEDSWKRLPQTASTTIKLVKNDD